MNNYQRIEKKFADYWPNKNPEPWMITARADFEHAGKWSDIRRFAQMETSPERVDFALKISKEIYEIINRPKHTEPVKLCHVAAFIISDLTDYEQASLELIIPEQWLKGLKQLRATVTAELKEEK